MKPPQQSQKEPARQGPRIDPDDVVGGFLDIASKIALFGGGLIALGVIAYLAYMLSAFSGGGVHPAPDEQAVANIQLVSRVFYVAIVAAVAGATYLFWGEEVLAAILLIVSGAIWATPLYLPSMFGSSGGGVVGGSALGVLQLGGAIMGGASILVLVADIIVRIRVRAQQGARSDLLKYGKGVKEEKQVKNVFMGKCWQLPFCRKFVREACPIYHSRRTCWRERVGCMCEEEVIRKAMEGRPIPKDMVAATKFIPYNNKIPLAAKQERCRQCVIYNEHQKHKYKLWLWIALGSFAGLYVLLRQPLLGALSGMIGRIDAIFSQMTFSKGGAVTGQVQNAQLPFHEFLLVCFMVVGLAYALKVIEYAIFKLKL